LQKKNNVATNRKLKNSELNRIDVAGYKSAGKTPLIIILDNIRSLNNVGSVFRTADSFLVEKVCLCGITATPPHREIQKTALGATESVDWQHYDTVDSCIQELKQNGYSILAIEQAENTVSLNDYKPSSNQKLAIVMGNEVNGVSQEAVDAADVCLEIPQYGTKHSLNISVCTGIVIWDLFNKLK
jgi:23S rRNA (guanosine2251-2'-O)-methyltransferase